jgi:hypothetical protein
MINNGRFELPRCSPCETIRELITVEAAAERYEIRSYQCPACRSVLKMVERTDPTMFPSAKSSA